MSADNIAPIAIELHKRSATLELIYSDSERYVLSAEFLRVHSPSAEVRGHGKNQEVLQTARTWPGPGSALARLSGQAERCRRQPRSIASGYAGAYNQALTSQLIHFSSGPVS